MNPLASNHSICIRCRICWQTIYAENERSMQELHCHSCIQSNVMAGVILWLVMSHGFSSIHHYVAGGLCREMIWSQNRDMILRAKDSSLRSYGIQAASMLSTDPQIRLKWTATILWQIHLFHLNKRSFSNEVHHTRNNLWFILTIAQFIKVGLQ
jgi:hypothetical protein